MSEGEKAYAIEALVKFAAFATSAQSGRGSSTYERTSRIYCNAMSDLVIPDILSFACRDLLEGSRVSTAQGRKGCNVQ